ALLHYIAYATSGEFSGEELAPANGVALANAPPPPSVTISVAQDPHAPPTFDAYTDGDRFQWMLLRFNPPFSIDFFASALEPQPNWPSIDIPVDLTAPVGSTAIGIQGVSTHGRIASTFEAVQIAPYWRAVDLGSQLQSEPWIHVVDDGASVEEATGGGLWVQSQSGADANFGIIGKPLVPNGATAEVSISLEEGSYASFTLSDGASELTLYL